MGQGWEKPGEPGLLFLLDDTGGREGMAAVDAAGMEMGEQELLLARCTGTGTGCALQREEVRDGCPGNHIAPSPAPPLLPRGI